jgi:tripeptidyl-peptidase-1
MPKKRAWTPPVLVALLCASGASGVAISRVVIEPDVTPGLSALWSKGRRATSDALLTVHFVMKKTPAQLAALEERLFAVSTPGSVHYGLHLSQSQVDAMVAPTAEARNVIASWLSSHKIAAKLDRDVVRLSLRVSEAEALLATELYEYTAGTTGRMIVRADRHYSLPADVAEHILLVSDITTFPDPQAGPIIESAWEVEEARRTAAEDLEGQLPRSASAAWPTGCGACADSVFGKRVTPQVLQQAYGLSAPQEPIPPHASSIAVAEFQGVYFDQPDLDQFAQTCGLPGGTLNFTHIGDNKPKKCSIPIIIAPDMCIEALLDLEVVAGVANVLGLSPLALTDVYNDGYSIIGWAQQLQAMPNTTLSPVQSISYGRDEEQEVSTIGRASG